MREVCSWSDRHPVKVQAACKAAVLTRVLPTFVPRREENAERRKWKSPLNFFILRGFLRTQNTTQVRMRNSSRLEEVVFFRMLSKHSAWAHSLEGVWDGVEAEKKAKTTPDVGGKSVIE